jgi:hypothetical protein
MEKHRPAVFQFSLYLVLQPVFLVTPESAAEIHVTCPLFWAVLTKIIIVIMAVVFIMC